MAFAAICPYNLRMFLLHSDIFFWDLAILMALAVFLAVAIGCFLLAKRPQIGAGKTVLMYTLGTIATACFALGVYASFVEPHVIVVTKKTLEHPMGHSMKIAVVSDMHTGPYKDKAFVKRMVNKINATLPDLVLIPGDFVFTHSAEISDLQPLEDISAPMGVYAVLGNHDVGQYADLAGNRYSGESRGEAIADVLTGLGVFVLRNRHDIISTHEGDVAIAGVDDIWTGHHDLPAALADIPKSAFTILLSHNPSIVDSAASMAAHLIVSGHTHGGQVRMPGIGPIAKLPTSLGKSYDQGLFGMDEDTTLAITRGIGESSARTRLFAWPEILLIQVEPTR